MKADRVRFARFALALVLLLIVARPALAVHFKLVGVDFIGNLWDIDTTSGAATNKRSLGVGLATPIGLATQPNTGTLFSITTFGSSSLNNSLFTIDVATGLATKVGPTGLSSVVEGDLAFQPITGKLVAAGVINTNGTRSFFSVNPATGAATLGSLLTTDDLSALAFAPNGTLYGIDSRTNTGNASTLVVLNPSTGAVQSVKSLSLTIGDDAGMAFDPETGGAFVASRVGGTAGINLCRLDTATGTMLRIGTTAPGISGLAFVPIPEPSTVALAAVALVAFVGIAVRRARRSAP